MRIELELKGDSLPRGKMWVNCHDKDGICFQTIPNCSEPHLPPPPKMNPGDRMVYSMYYGKKAGWEKVAEPSPDVVASGGFSLMAIIAAAYAFYRYRKKKEGRRQAD